jgi:hypothetical protein
MKSSPALLLAATLLVAGCVTEQPPTPPATPPTALGSDTTPWGVLPRYEGARLRPKTGFSRTAPPAPGEVVADVLVEREGKVREVKIVEVNGSAATARTALAMLQSGTYEPLPADGPELYVVRQTIVLKTDSRSSIPSVSSGADGGGNSNMPANQAPPPVYSR